MVLKLERVETSAQVSSAQSQKTDSSSNAPMFNGQSSGSSSNESWNPNFNKYIKDLSISGYVWTPISGNEDAINKSQNSLIDMIRYYEGDRKNNYKATTQYNDKNKVTTYGYGVTKLPEDVKKKYNVSLPPKTDKDAYNIMLIYMKEVALPDVKAVIGENLYNQIPNSIKEALLDYAFKNGRGVLKASKDKFINALKKGVEKNNWTDTLNLLVYVKSGETGKEEAGLHRRSLSRAILATRDLPKTPEIKNAVKKIYDNAVKYTDKKNLSTTELKNIYENYSEGKISGSSNSKNNAQYKISDDLKSYWGVANAVCPKNDKNGTPLTPTVRKLYINAILDAIIKSNPDLKLLSPGKDSDGYLIINGKFSKELFIPDSVNFNDSTKITLSIPENWKNQDSASKSIQQNDENIYVVKQGDGYMKIARMYAPENTSESDINNYSKLISSANGNRNLSIGDSVIVPPYVKQNNNPSPQDDNGDNGGGNEDSSMLDHMTAQFPYEDVKILKGESGDNIISNLECREYKYTILKGDTYWKLSNNYSINIPILKSYNSKTSDNLREGEVIKLPKIIYKIRKGDTLNKISKELGIKIEILKDLNSIEDINKIKMGQSIEIPGYPYVVKKGDTLSGIAKKMGVNVDVLKSINGLKSDKISPGDRLVILFNNADYNASEDEKKKINNSIGKKYISNEVHKDKNNKEYEFYKKHYLNKDVVATEYEWAPTNKNGKLKGRTIIVNPGHGYTSAGHDPGTTNKNANYTEAEINYLNAIALSDKLRAQGATVIFIQGGVNLAGEAIRKNKSKAEMVISIHVNSSAKEEQTNDHFQVYYNSIKKGGETLAKSIESNMDEKHKSNLEYAQTKNANHYVTRQLDSNKPAVLVELGFLNNPNFRKATNINPVRNEAVDAIYQAVLNYRWE